MLPATTYPAIDWDKLDAARMERMADLLKVLAHPVRLRIVEELSESVCNVNELRLRIDPDLEHSLMSHHLNKMRLHGLLTSHRKGAHIEYELTEPTLINLIHCARACQI